jgi:hypothetical protein
VLSDAEPDVPARRWVAALDIEELRRRKDAVIFRRVVHEHDDALAFMKTVTGEDDALRDAPKRERRRDDQPECFVDRLLHELRLRAQASHLMRIQKDGDDARERRGDSLRADKEEGAKNRLHFVRVESGRAQSRHHRVL